MVKNDAPLSVAGFTKKGNGLTFFTGRRPQFAVQWKWAFRYLIVCKMIDNAGIYDVAIIGGGVGGLTPAIQCAGAGYKTILLKKKLIHITRFVANTSVWKAFLSFNSLG